MLGVALCCTTVASAQSRIMKPGANETIQQRLDFVVGVAVRNYEADLKNGHHFWVSIALGHDQNLQEQWPKFYVKSAQYEAHTSDGGTNPLPAKQAMTLLLLRVDGARNQAFIRWLQEGNRTRQYPALNVVEREIVHRLPIYFP